MRPVTWNVANCDGRGPVAVIPTLNLRDKLAEYYALHIPKKIYSINLALKKIPLRFFNKISFSINLFKCTSYRNNLQRSGQ